MATNGGKREGAGRKKGSTTKPQLRDYISTAEVKKIIEEAKTKAKAGDTTMLKFILEQIFGKAPQSMDLTSGGDKFEALQITGIVINDPSDKKEITNKSKP